MNFALRIPDYYKGDIEELKGDVSINQFIVNAIAEKIATLKTVDYLKQRANNATIDDMEKLLDKVEDREPEIFDKI
jgi:NMD protein affecting ribosome stability and mRNA decay